MLTFSVQVAQLIVVFGVRNSSVLRLEVTSPLDPELLREKITEIVPHFFFFSEIQGVDNYGEWDVSLTVSNFAGRRRGA